MEGNIVCLYLQSKFSSILRDAESDVGSSSKLISRFQSIEKLINSMNPKSGALVDPLYDLMDALLECTIFAAEAASFNFLRVRRFKSKMRSRLDRIEKVLMRPDLQHHTATAGPSRLVIQQTSPDIPDPSVIVGFESQVDKIEKLLMPVASLTDGKQFKSIGIVGRCGCGKTALTQKVFASLIEQNKFFPMIWVSLSERLFDDKRSDLGKRILKVILREMGHDASDLEYGHYSVVELQEKLRLRLMGKRYLIVLEDVWRRDKWFDDLGCCRGEPGLESFTRALPKGNGGAVIVTGRGEGVIRRMVGKTHVIRPHLTGEFCWEIFGHAVRQQGKIDLHHPKLIEMEESVKNNCKGLPLAAKTLAYVISNFLADRDVVQL